MPHAAAAALAIDIGHRWGFDKVSRQVGPVWTVGSLRRNAPMVGDIEFLAPHQDKAGDLVYELIEPTLAMPGSGDLIFAPPADTIGRPTEGFRKGFLSASFEVTLGGVTVPVQVFRYTPQNKGWQLIMRTGPQEFGIHFLGEWKRAFGIPLGVESCKASRDGHLIDSFGVVVPVESEEEAFQKAGMRFVPPQQREAWRKS